MRFKIIVLTGLAGLLLFAPMARAAGPCCDEDKACCKDMAACCNNDADMIAASVLVPRTNVPVTPIRQTAVVWFVRPVVVGSFILQGQYLIEHDMNRMAKGQPCTHIYAASKPTVPVVKFHCTHLERPRVEFDTVVFQPTGDPAIPSKLASFQFAGETAAHGVPGVR